MDKLSIKTGRRTDFLDITGQVQALVSSSGITGGVCHVFVPYTTAGITLNEHADPSVVEDIATRLDTVVPWNGGYRHTEGNAAAHIKSTMAGSSATLFIDKGRLVLGTWQGIFFCEFDGPRMRTVLVKIIPG
jgi:secondary thiamine-phosphate synthase enzyme